MVPHFCAELWETTGHQELMEKVSWPDFDPEAAREDELTIVVQVKGKVRSRLQVPAGTDEDKLKELALADERIIKFIGDAPVRKIIVIKNKLLNIVI